MNKNLEASKNPIGDIDLIAPTGQKPTMRIYQPGYEDYFNQLPVLKDDDPFLQQKVNFTKMMMQKMAADLETADWVTGTNVPGTNEFTRTILALETPYNNTPCLGIPGSHKRKLKEGTEIVLAKWGDGFTSPVHGHAVGYMHEEIIFGKIIVMTYRMIAPDSTIVRPVRMDLIEKGTFVSDYTMKNPNHKFQRQTLIHNFKSVGFSASLHYLPEHTRDGRDNKFEVEGFDEKIKLTTSDVERVTGQQALYSQIGDVILVRSSNVPYFGDHYIVITGHPVMKPHGLRPQDVAIPSTNSQLLDKYNGELVLLKLKDAAKKEFYDFHAMSMNNGKVEFAKY